MMNSRGMGCAHYKKGGSVKMTDALDDKMDKKAGIKEGSKKDLALDKKRGVPEDEVTTPKAKAIGRVAYEKGGDDRAYKRGGKVKK